MTYQEVDRTFRYGNGQMLTSKYEVLLPERIFDQERLIKMSVVPGSAPLLVARTVLEEWGLVLDFRNHMAMLLDTPELGWLPMRQSGRDHLLLELVPRATEARLDEVFARTTKSPGTSSRTARARAAPATVKRATTRTWRTSMCS